MYSLDVNVSASLYFCQRRGGEDKVGISGFGKNNPENPVDVDFVS